MEEEKRKLAQKEENKIDNLSGLDTPRKMNIIQVILNQNKAKEGQIQFGSKIIQHRLSCLGGTENPENCPTPQKYRKPNKLDPYKLRKDLFKKWIKVRNIIVAVSRFNKIMKDVVTYGTSSRLLDKRRNSKFLREFMMPDISMTKSTI